MMTATPSPASLVISQNPALAPTSMPRVGSSRMRIFGSVSSQRPIRYLLLVTARGSRRTSAMLGVLTRSLALISSQSWSPALIDEAGLRIILRPISAICMFPARRGSSRCPCGPSVRDTMWWRIAVFGWSMTTSCR